MNQITLKVNSKAKDILNQMIVERNGLGYIQISKCVDDVCFELKAIKSIENIGFRNKLINLTIEDRKTKIERDFILPQDMKDHLKNLITTIGKTHIRQTKPTYVIFDPITFKMPEITKHSNEWQTLNSASKWLKKLSNRDSKDYEIDTLFNYKNRQYAAKYK